MRGLNYGGAIWKTFPYSAITQVKVHTLSLWKIRSARGKSRNSPEFPLADPKFSMERLVTEPNVTMTQCSSGQKPTREFLAARD